MLIKMQSGQGFVNLDNVFHVYATEHGAVMVRMLDDQNFALADYETNEEAVREVNNILDAYLECNVEYESNVCVKNIVYEMAPRSMKSSRRSYDW